MSLTSLVQPSSDEFSRRSSSLRGGPSSLVTTQRTVQDGGEAPLTNTTPHAVFDRDGVKYYCTRNVVQPLDCVNTSVLDCSVTFTVDKNICVLGVQVPTQTQVSKQRILLIFSKMVADIVKFIFKSNSSPQQGNLYQSDSSYTEVLYAHLLDSDGSRLTYTHFTTKVNSGTLVEITFNRPVYIQKNKV